MHVVIALRVALAMAAIGFGCGNPPAHVSLVPVGTGSCGTPAGATAIAVTAYSTAGEVTRAVPLDQAVDLAGFPDGTTQLGVEVAIGAGEVGAAGKTLPLVFGELADGVEIPIVMTPPGGFCPVGPLLEARKGPVAARAGEGVLVVGGLGASGPLSTAEFYDPRTATFSPVEVPDVLHDEVEGIAGASLATLPDGRVVLTHTNVLTVFDPATKSFGATFAIGPQRAFHGAAAIDATHVLLAGGCHGVVFQTCDTALRSTFVYDLQGKSVAGTNLTIDAIAEGGRLFDTGTAFVLAGGFGTFGEAQRFEIADSDAVKLTGLAAQPALLDGHALLTAFDLDAALPPGPVNVVSPGGVVAGLASAPLLPGADVRLVTVENGGVLAIGGDTNEVMGVAHVAHYNPMRDTWDQVLPTAAPRIDAMTPRPVGEQPGSLVAPTLVPLADGTVLVLGGEAAPSPNAWIYRPSLVGPASGSITAIPTSDASQGILTASDPTTLARGVADWVLTAPDDTLAARALLGGPRMQRGSIKVALEVRAGGFALIAQQVTPDRALVAHLIPDKPARLEQLGEGTVCTGSTVALPEGAVVATLVVGDGVVVQIGDKVVLSCSYDASAIGAWGVAASGAGSSIAVATVTVAR